MPCYVDGLVYDVRFAASLLSLSEAFLEDNSLPLRRVDADLIRRISAARPGGELTGYLFLAESDRHLAVADLLLRRPELQARHRAALHLWRARCLAEKQAEQALYALEEAASHLPGDSPSLGEAIGRRFNELAEKFIWPEGAANSVPSELGLRAARASVALLPNDGSAWYKLGVALRDHKTYQEAIEVYQRALALEQRATRWNGIGSVYSDLGRQEEALAAYGRAIELDPKYASPHNGVGNVYRALGRQEEALAAYGRAIELDPKLASPHHGVGNVYSDLGRQEEALAAYGRAIELDPKDASPHNGVGNVYRALGRQEEALAAYGRAIALDPKLAAPQMSLAGIYRKLGDEEAWRRQMGLVQSLVVEESEYNRACFASICGDLDGALTLLEAAIAKSPGDRITARRDPDFDFIRDDPRFRALVGEDE